MDEKSILKVNLPITASMLTFALNRKQFPFVNKIKVNIEEPCINVTFFISVKSIQCKLTMALQPTLHRNERYIFLKIMRIYPRWFSFIKVLRFSKRRVLMLKNGYITLDLNNFLQLNKIKGGKIQKLVVKKKILWCSIEM
jgi:hypothetical protein